MIQNTFLQLNICSI